MHLPRIAFPLLAAATLAAASCQPNPSQPSEAPSDEVEPSPPPEPMETAEVEPAASETETPPPQPEPPKLSDADKAFIDKAAAGNLAEVELGNLALTKSKKKEVKELAQKMVDHHGKLNDELSTLARGKGVEVPTALDETATATKAELEKLSGSKFDKKYVAVMKDDHTKDIELFRDQSQNGQDAELKAWAATTLPKLEEHLAHIDAVAAGKPYKPAAPQASATPPAGDSGRAAPTKTASG